jgi:hypothetical protein
MSQEILASFGPVSLQQEFTAFREWATAEVVPGREAPWRKRPATVDNYRIIFQSYFGFLRHRQHLESLSFNLLSDVDLLRAYVFWHVQEHQSVTKMLHLFFQYILAIHN